MNLADQTRVGSHAIAALLIALLALEVSLRAMQVDLGNPSCAQAGNCSSHTSLTQPPPWVWAWR